MRTDEHFFLFLVRAQHWFGDEAFFLWLRVDRNETADIILLHTN